MTTSRIHPADEEEAIRFFRKQHNEKQGTSLTAGQYADLVAANTFQSLIPAMTAEREGEELFKAFKAASTQTKADVRAALGIQNP